MPDLQQDDLFFALQEDLDRILRRVRGESSPKVTLIIRTPEIPDSHVIIGNDDLDAVIATIQRYKELPPRYKPEPL